MSINVNTPRRIFFAGVKPAMGQYDVSRRPPKQNPLPRNAFLDRRSSVARLLLLREY
jgi:hypothetical protein